jgi:hypothetical protein
MSGQIKSTIAVSIVQGHSNEERIPKTNHSTKLNVLSLSSGDVLLEKTSSKQTMGSLFFSCSLGRARKGQQHPRDATDVTKAAK